MFQDTQNPQTTQIQSNEVLTAEDTASIETQQPEIQEAAPVVESTAVSEQLPTDTSSDNPASRDSESSVVLPAEVVETPTPDPEVKSAEAISDDTNELIGDDIYLKEVKRVIREDGAVPFAEEEDAETIQVDYMANHFGVKMKKGEDK